MKVAILGLGVDTQDVIPYLEKQGAKITILDEKKGDKFENLDQFDLIIRSPGVYRFRPEIVAAEQAGVKISSKTKLFFDLCPAKIIGITGTKGKGTTATLIYEILKAAGKDVYLGGNIGAGIFGNLSALSRNSWVILELSSFQLIDLHQSPHIAVILMVTSEHLDWHKDEAEYLGAKSQLILHQNGGDYVVANRDYPKSREIAEKSDGKIIWVSAKDAQNFTTKLRGAHNRENIAAAVAVAKIVGIAKEAVKTVVANFSGLEHRLEEVATVNGVTFYNDSFSTVPETAIAAIKSFTEPLIIILGGSEKGSDFTKLGKAIVQAKNIKAIILIGLMSGKIQAAITASARGPLAKGVVMPKILHGGGKNMAEIVKAAYNKAAPGDVVLLSPACASFDMFRNYKDRGEQFRQAVKNLK